MKKLAIIIFLLLLLVIFEGTVLDYIRIFNVKPELTLAAVVALGFYYSWGLVLIFSFFAGLFKDILALTPLGINTIIFLLIGYLTVRLSKRFIIESLSLRMTIISAAVILENLIAQLTLSFYLAPVPLGVFLRTILIAAVYTALISPLIIKVIYHL